MHFRIGPSEKKSVLFADKVFKTEKDYLQTNNQMGDYIWISFIWGKQCRYNISGVKGKYFKKYSLEFKAIIISLGEPWSGHPFHISVEDIDCNEKEWKGNFVWC